MTYSHNLDALAPEKRNQLERALIQEIRRRENTNKLKALYPNEGELSRHNYPKHLAFFAAGAIHNERAAIAANRVGTDGKNLPYAGDSVAHDFLGDTLAQLGGEPAVITVELDLPSLRAFRDRFPAHLDADRFTLDA